MLYLRGFSIVVFAISVGSILGFLRSGTSTIQHATERPKVVGSDEPIPESNSSHDEQCRKIVTDWILSLSDRRSGVEFWKGAMPMNISLAHAYFLKSGNTSESFYRQINPKYKAFRRISSWTFLEEGVGGQVVVEVAHQNESGEDIISVWEFTVALHLSEEPVILSLERSLKHDKQFQNRIESERDILEKWLDSQRRGRTGFDFWHPAVRNYASRLIAVRDWTIVDTDSFGGSPFTVRISSSTKGGFSIEKLWTVIFDNDRYENGEPKIISVTETISD